MAIFVTQNPKKVKEAWTSVSCTGKGLCHLKKKVNKISHANFTASLGCLTPVWCFIHLHLTNIFFMQMH